MSALSQLPIFNGSLEEVFSKAESKGYTIFLFQLDESSEALPNIRFPEKSVLVFGNEGNGIRPELKKSTRISVKIPDYSSGKAESLNVSTAASVALFAYRNQRNKI
jgi:tRNA G18 (ribose-2'-O)-methylase SpoU